MWLPWLNNWSSSAFLRDIERAQKKWELEDRIWLYPNLKEKKKWIREFYGFTFTECAIPSETLNFIDVVRVSNDGDMYPPFVKGIPQEWKGKLPTNLLLQWLNSDNPSPIQANDSFEMHAPFFYQDQVIFRKVPVNLSPGPIFPTTDINEEKKEIVFGWPPNEGNIIDTVSPEAESYKILGQYSWDDGIDHMVLNNDGKRAEHIALYWPAPFNEMFPLGGGMDLLKQKNDMNECIRDIDSNKFIIAKNACRLSSQGETTLEKQLINPMLMTKSVDELLFKIEGSYNIVVNRLEDLINHRDYKEAFLKSIPVTNIYGWEGYFWWELNNKVNDIKHCSLCGKIITGKKDKVYCNKKENEACFKDRTNANKRKRYKNKKH